MIFDSTSNSHAAFYRIALYPNYKARNIYAPGT